jgi:hypothetical protein
MTWGAIFFGYAGTPIAMLTLIENSVRATIRQSDSEAIASEAATASFSRVEATGAALPLKPAAPVDRIMACSFEGAAESTPRDEKLFAAIAGNIGAGTAPKAAK